MVETYFMHFRLNLSVIFAVQSARGLTWFWQQVEWVCKHAERREAGSLIPGTNQ